MADFEKIDRNMSFVRTGNWYTMTGELTDKDIEDINQLKVETIISVASTKGIS